MFRWIGRRFKKPPIAEEEYRRERERVLSSAPIPLFWLFGKTGSGKSSVVRYLTGADEAEIGNGFRPQTRTSHQYDFPTADHPALRFLDTRGLGEGDYDPTEDIERFNDSTHLMIVTVRVMDHALEDVLQPLRTFREANPQRPVLLALTCLHDAYPGRQHPAPDPFEASSTVGGVPTDLARSIERHRQTFTDLVDRVVPIDLTRPEEGFEVPDFGGERLKAAVLELLPAAYRQTFLNLNEAVSPLKSLNERRAMPYVIGYSTLAASAAAVPIPWIDIPVVVAIQWHLVRQLGSLYDEEFDAAVLRRLGAAVGGQLVTRMVVRETLKVIPYAGSAASAAFAYAYTYGLGKACCWYFGEVQAGNSPTEEEIRAVWGEQLAIASRLWSKHRRQAEAVSDGRASAASDSEHAAEDASKEAEA